VNTEDLRRLAARAEGIEGRQVDRLTELHGRVRTARRRSGAVAVAAAAAVVVVVAGGTALSRTGDRTQEPADDLTPHPTPSETIATDGVPAGQQTIAPDIGAGDIRGWELRGSRTNTDPGSTGATHLSLAVEVGGLYGAQSQIVQFCNGDADTWWVLALNLGGVDGQRNPDGSMQDGTRGLYGRCDREAPAEIPPATGDIGPWQWDEAAKPYPIQMFVTDEIPATARECIAGTDTFGCLARHAVEPLDETDATFGFGVYEHLEAPIVMTVPGGRFQALLITKGVEYLVDRAVTATPGEPRIVVRLPASDRSRVVAFFQRETSAMNECVEQLGHGVPTNAEEERAQYDEASRRCFTETELRIDGERRSTDPQHQIVLPPGEVHDVTVEVTKNDPRNVRYSLVIWQER
jgi:hypothetical protein